MVKSGQRCTIRVRRVAGFRLKNGLGGVGSLGGLG